MFPPFMYRVYLESIQVIFMAFFLSFSLVSDVALIIPFLLDLHDVIRFPRLVEEREIGSVEEDDRHVVPSFDGSL